MVEQVSPFDDLAVLESLVDEAYAASWAGQQIKYYERVKAASSNPAVSKVALLGAENAVLEGIGSSIKAYGKSAEFKRMGKSVGNFFKSLGKFLLGLIDIVLYIIKEILRGITRLITWYFEKRDKKKDGETAQAVAEQLPQQAEHVPVDGQPPPAPEGTEQPPQEGNPPEGQAPADNAEPVKEGLTLTEVALAVDGNEGIVFNAALDYMIENGGGIKKVSSDNLIDFFTENVKVNGSKAIERKKYALKVLISLNENMDATKPLDDIQQILAELKSGKSEGNTGLADGLKGELVTIQGRIAETSKAINGIDGGWENITKEVKRSEGDSKVAVRWETPMHVYEVSLAAVEKQIKDVSGTKTIKSPRIEKQAVMKDDDIDDVIEIPMDKPMTRASFSEQAKRHADEVKSKLAEIGKLDEALEKGNRAFAKNLEAVQEKMVKIQQTSNDLPEDVQASDVVMNTVNAYLAHYHHYLACNLVLYKLMELVMRSGSENVQWIDQSAKLLVLTTRQIYK